MGDRFYGGIRPGVTELSIFVRLTRLSDNQDALGLLAADVAASYVRTRGLPVAIVLADLSAPDDPWESGGWIEVDATPHPGLYRLDVPAAAVVAGADEVAITVTGADLFAFHRAYPLETRRSLRRGVPVPGYTFVMRQTANPGLGATALSGLLVERSLDGGTLAPCANAPVEVGAGAYAIDLTAADLDGDVVTLRMAADTALDTWVTHVLEPAGGD